MYSTDIFDFGTSTNGYLVSSHSFLRGVFLIFACPLIITSQTNSNSIKSHKHSYAAQIT